MLRLFILALSLAAATPASGQGPAYPREVQTELEDARKTCLDADGKDVVIPPSAVRRIDLTGDGRDDYIIFLHEVECKERLSLYCGTGGCDFVILVAKPDGSLAPVFGQRIRNYEVIPGRGARRIRFELHGSFCGRSGNPSCYKTRRISAKPFVFKEP